jgi:MoxR-like ATPase
MPRAAAAILQFIRRSVLHPDKLAVASAEFAALPYIRGIQSGMLSPILNALRPDDFAIYNSRARSLLEYFAGGKYPVSIAAYPAANSAIAELVADIGDEILSLSGRLKLSRFQIFDLFVRWMVTEKGFFRKRRQEPQETRYWKISPGDIPSQWEECRNGNFIGLGWEELGDVSTMSRDEFRREQDRLLALHPDWKRAGLNQVWRFARVGPGDRIIVTNGPRQILGTGTVTGDYYFVPGARYGHRLPVLWDQSPPRKMHRKGWRQTLLEYDKSLEEASLAGHARVGEQQGRYRGKGGRMVWEVQPVYSLEELALDTGFDPEVVGGWVRAVERKGQAILYGPPGTGKTYVAMRLARHLAGGGNGFIDVVQFHPTYAYEDFVQGIRPMPGEAGGLEYPLVPGRFLEFCERAAGRTGRCVLVIDEINRANLSRVFGELMYLLEYRAQDVALAGGRRFSIPRNVRIIGTMNTADRSIALVDHALRRRFAFLELRPDYRVLERYHREHNPEFNVAGLIELLQRVNRAIGDRHYEIGISYFLRDDIAGQIEDIWRTEIETYLDEYFFDQPEKASAFGWDAVGGVFARSGTTGQ